MLPEDDGIVVEEERVARSAMLMTSCPTRDFIGKEKNDGLKLAAHPSRAWLGFFFLQLVNI